MLWGLIFLVLDRWAGEPDGRLWTLTPVGDLPEDVITLQFVGRPPVGAGFENTGCLFLLPVSACGFLWFLPLVVRDLFWWVPDFLFLFVCLFWWLSVDSCDFGMLLRGAKLRVYYCVILKMEVSQSCLTLCDPMDYTVNGILLARILEWVAVPFSRGSSQPRDWTQASHVAGRFFTSWATREAPMISSWPLQKKFFFGLFFLLSSIYLLICFLIHSLISWNFYLENSRICLKNAKNKKQKNTHTT